MLTDAVVIRRFAVADCRGSMAERKQAGSKNVMLPYRSRTITLQVIKEGPTYDADREALKDRKYRRCLVAEPTRLLYSDTL